MMSLHFICPASPLHWGVHVHAWHSWCCEKSHASNACIALLNPQWWLSILNCCCKHCSSDPMQYYSQESSVFESRNKCLLNICWREWLAHHKTVPTLVRFWIAYRKHYRHCGIRREGRSLKSFSSMNNINTSQRNHPSPKNAKYGNTTMSNSKSNHLPIKWNHTGDVTADSVHMPSMCLDTGSSLRRTARGGRLAGSGPSSEGRCLECINGVMKEAWDASDTVSLLPTSIRQCQHAGLSHKTRQHTHSCILGTFAPLTTCCTHCSGQWAHYQRYTAHDQGSPLWGGRVE